ncbi:putative sad1 interacting factor 1 protein [Phialemonium atrogriseum]|uniref:Sad1 interacting factor 1 protein n=1 Tax=Phialemonium atrogriseum TaxID=1093897 RepID=A0AAJ0CA46_9PEZI|nr:putative sad1 interacting factor 1 protein [Phialemonium atrogriseum]KAK1772958.1 putative sad1 interacting factor 1 protein [Phialemonium atrogriseum]
MTEGASTSSDDAAAARAAEQARLRKERREAKIKAGGAARLNRITGLGGGIQRDPAPMPSEDATSGGGGGAPRATNTEHADPEEVDISQHYYAPRTSAAPSPGAAPFDPAGVSEAQLRQMMLGFEAPGVGAGPGMGMGMGMGPGAAGAGEDPMMKLLQQMMAGGPGGPGGFPPPGASPFGGPQQQQQQAVVPDRYSALWRLLHTAVALGLGLYIALWTPFSGTKLERDHSGLPAAASAGERKDGGGGGSWADGGAPDPRFFFWAFATAETVLLTTRFFLDRSRAPPGGALWSLAGFLPVPLKGYLETGLRYGQMFSTVKSDILVCIFVLGVCA